MKLARPRSLRQIIITSATDQTLNMSKQNTRVEIQEFNAENPLSGVKVVQKRIPEPRADEVLVNVTLRPVNPSDVMCCMGIYPAFAKETPAVPGWDGEGHVLKSNFSTCLSISRQSAALDRCNCTCATQH